MKFVVEAGRFRPWNTGFKDYKDNFLAFFSFGLGVGLTLAYLGNILLVITVFVLTIFGILFSFVRFVSFVPNFVVDFYVGTFFFFVTIFFFFVSGALMVEVNIVKSMLWRFL